MPTPSRYQKQVVQVVEVACGALQRPAVGTWLAVALTLGLAVGCTQSAGKANGGTDGGLAAGGNGPGLGGTSADGGSPGVGGKGAIGGTPGSGGVAQTGGITGSGGVGGTPGVGGRGGNAGTQGTGGQGGRGGRAGSSSGGSSAGGKAGAASGGAAGTTAVGGAGGAVSPGTSPTIAGCPILPANNLFNTPIDALPVDPQSAAYLSTIGNHNLHLDLGSSTNINMVDTYYGIPYNVVHGATDAWVTVRYGSTDSGLDWDPRSESDCVDAASGAAHTKVSPCAMSTAPNPVFPIPAKPLVEGGIDTDPSQPYGDHHILLLDADACVLHELYHAYPRAAGGWDIFGSAIFDLRSNTLRPNTWTSADAAGFPILPLLLRADEASSGTIRHALRFTITSSKIRNAATWPARHNTSNGTTSTNLPPMGQLFRLKASYAIPSTFGTQARAIAQAMKTYGMYIADGGSDMYVQGEPHAGWTDATISQVQSIGSAQFEAVDLTPVRQRTGFSVNSGAVPPP